MKMIERTRSYDGCPRQPQVHEITHRMSDGRKSTRTIKRVIKSHVESYLVSEVIYREVNMEAKWVADLSPSEEAGRRTKNRIREHGPTFEILDRKAYLKVLDGPAILVRSRRTKWVGWLIDNEVIEDLRDD